MSALFPDNLFNLIRSFSSEYKSRLTYNAFGFGKTHNEFILMEETINIAKEFGVKAAFGSGYFDVGSLGTMLSSTVTSVTETRTLLSRLHQDQTIDCSVKREKTYAEKEIYTPSNVFKSDDWDIYNTKSRGREELIHELNKDTHIWAPIWKPVAFIHPNATGFAIRKKYFGEGAERIVYHMIEVNSEGAPVGEPLVAKESLWKHKKQDEFHLRKWHKVFVRTQQNASKYAVKFNRELDKLGVDKTCPRLSFLPCSVYFGSSNNNRNGEIKYFLSERRLDGKYVKYNNNAGGTDGIVQENAIIDEKEFLSDDILSDNNRASTKPTNGQLGILQEEDSDDSDDEFIDDMVEDTKAPISNNMITANHRVSELQKQVLECDIPQAFSHWTNVYTQRELLVCDIQGRLDMADNYPIFILTDPCIHSNGKKSFGRTDHGKDGMRNFHKTHQCNAVCEILGIANKSRMI